MAKEKTVLVTQGPCHLFLLTRSSYVRFPHSKTHEWSVQSEASSWLCLWEISKHAKENLTRNPSEKKKKKQSCSLLGLGTTPWCFCVTILSLQTTHLEFSDLKAESDTFQLPHARDRQLSQLCIGDNKPAIKTMYLEILQRLLIFQFDKKKWSN